MWRGVSTGRSWQLSCAHSSGVSQGTCAAMRAIPAYVTCSIRHIHGFASKTRSISSVECEELLVGTDGDRTSCFLQIHYNYLTFLLRHHQRFAMHHHGQEEGTWMKTLIDTCYDVPPNVTWRLTGNLGTYLNAQCLMVIMTNEWENKKCDGCLQVAMRQIEFLIQNPSSEIAGYWCFDWSVTSDARFREITGCAACGWDGDCGGGGECWGVEPSSSKGYVTPLTHSWHKRGYKQNANMLKGFVFTTFRMQVPRYVCKTMTTQHFVLHKNNSHIIYVEISLSYQHSNTPRNLPVLSSLPDCFIAWCGYSGRSGAMTELT